MFCLYSVSKNSKIIQIFMFSEIMRPKKGIIDPSPLKFRYKLVKYELVNTANVLLLSIVVNLGDSSVRTQ